MTQVATSIYVLGIDLHLDAKDLAETLIKHGETMQGECRTLIKDMGVAIDFAQRRLVGSWLVQQDGELVRNDGLISNDKTGIIEIKYANVAPLRHLRAWIEDGEVLSLGMYTEIRIDGQLELIYGLKKDDEEGRLYLKYVSDKWSQDHPQSEE